MADLKILTYMYIPLKDKHLKWPFSKWFPDFTIWSGQKSWYHRMKSPVIISRPLLLLFIPHTLLMPIIISSVFFFFRFLSPTVASICRSILLACYSLFVFRWQVCLPWRKAWVGSSVQPLQRDSCWWPSSSWAQYCATGRLIPTSQNVSFYKVI